ncbi:hypothetical protein PHMEG_0009701 [Phytophthora megakarya]|uniref:peptidylprolyl isomerase n=1 Tax=Phytophthora megakarya TaxID=4795 RepID=A0A225WI05_9STRA|nr:hypothetical protein PHMEG_0009701 [Phytophthora megakarya]
MKLSHSSDPVARRLVDGLHCDLDLYNSFIESEEGQDIFIMAALCESRIVSLKNARAGWYGPVPQSDLSTAMCSDECLRSDELHKKAMSESRCTCAQVSAEMFVQHTFCLESSARLLCTHLSECGHWGCILEDFDCLRFEWDRLYPCVGTRYTLLCQSTRTMNDRDAVRVHWALYKGSTCAKGVCVLRGSLPVDQVRVSRPQTMQDSLNKVSTSMHFTVDSTGIQLVPELQWRVWDLLEQQRVCQDQGDEKAMDLSVEVLSVVVEDLTLGSSVAELGLDGKSSLFCKMHLDEETRTQEREEKDWFSWKWQRATAYRVHGNDAFKQESYDAALRLYMRALAWLEPPAARAGAALDVKVQYSMEELQQVNFVAVACYANMATCYSKLNRDGDVDRCVAAASSALELDDAHVKARYRRSQAYAASKEFDLAVADLTKLRELEPDNKLFRAALTRTQSAKTQLRKKQQSAFANLFDE